MILRRRCNGAKRKAEAVDSNFFKFFEALRAYVGSFEFRELCRLYRGSGDFLLLFSGQRRHGYFLSGRGALCMLLKADRQGLLEISQASMLK